MCTNNNNQTYPLTVAKKQLQPVQLSFTLSDHTLNVDLISLHSWMNSFMKKRSDFSCNFKVDEPEEM